LTAAPPPVFVIVMENRGADSLVGNPDAPWINAALKKYGVALNYRAIGHPSQPNYLALTSGSTHGVTGDEDVTLHAPNIGSQLTARGMRWRAYMQAPVVRKHDPFATYGEADHIADLKQLGHGPPPEFGFVVPNECTDMHGAGGCGDLVRTGDRFLAATVASIRRWARRALIFVTWDEDEGGGSNRVLTLVIGGRNNASLRPYDHYSLLRTIEAHWDLGCLALACRAKPMTDLVD
jgi:hypothetical protein